MNRSRGKLAAINSTVATIAQIILIFMQFIARTVFIRELGEQYLGLNGLFINLLGMLNLAELGIGAAITFSLFEPIYKKDREQIAAIMHLLKKWYRIIALTVLVMGLILIPFIPHLIRNPEFSNFQLYVFFFLALAGTVSTYLLSFKRTLLIADQLGYLNTLNTVGYSIIQQSVQIVILMIYPNFYIYLLIQLVFNVVSNYSISKAVDRRYPFLNQYSKPVNMKILSYFKKNVAGMISAKIGGIVVNSTDNLLLSYYMGLGEVGLYANYTLITTGLTSILTQAVTAASSSIGNLAASKQKSHEMRVFDQYFSLTVLLSLFMAIGISTFSTAFISFWIGKQYVLTNLTVFLIAFNFLLQSIRQALISYANSYGLYWQQRYKPIFESAINLVGSILLIRFTGLGIAAVLIGTITSNLLVNFWWEPLVVFRDGFNQNVKPFLFRYGIIIFVSGVLLISVQSVGFRLVNLGDAILFTIVSIIITEIIMLILLRTLGLKAGITIIIKRVLK